MKWEFEFLLSPDYLRVTVQGLFTLEKQTEMFEEISALNEWHSGMPILFDNRQLKMTGVNESAIKRSVDIMRQFSVKHSTTKIAGLVGSGVNFGLGRQFETYTDIGGGKFFRLFKDENMALQWLLRS